MATCRLCGEDRDLVDSHIIPSFVIQQYQARNPGGLRANDQPNRRTQDGPKPPYFCSDCEQRFNQWETPFSREVFLPYLEDPSQDLPYGEWAYPFFVSVLFRTLLFFHHELGPPDHLNEAELVHQREVLETWRRYLLGETQPPTQHPVHIVPLDLLSEGTTAGVSPFINRLFTATPIFTDLTVADDGNQMVVAKLDRFLVVGEIAVPDPSAWQNTQVEPGSGVFRTGIQIGMPGPLLTHLQARADELAGTYDQLSQKQREKVEQRRRKYADQLRDSDAYRSFEADRRISGDAAFGNRTSEKDPE